ncbi:MAG: aldose epimerase family protein, partial [Terriglobales bacterium]
MKILLLLVLPLLAMASDKSSPQKRSWGKADGKEVDLFTLSNKKGMVVEITNFGATVVSIQVPDRHGKMADVALGFDSLAGYEPKTDPYMGAIVGRVGNRIAKASFNLEGHEYHLAANDGRNTLHGGAKGFDKRVWTVKDAGANHIALEYFSPDGEEGFPGNLDAKVTYTLEADNSLRIEYAVTTDKPTIQNLTNHTYFNLAGEGSGDVLKQQLTIVADKFTPTDKEMIPTGEIRPVAGTPFDFRTPHAIGERINDKDEQLVNGRGYDHNWVLSHAAGKVSLAARAEDPSSGRVLEVWTDQPGIQFYTGNFLDGSLKGEGGKPYVYRGAFCLETQHFPDAPHHAN